MLSAAVLFGSRNAITESRLLAVFRAVSLLLAAVVFLLERPDMPVLEQIVLLVCLAVEAWAVQHSYRWYRQNGYALGGVVAFEAVGVTFLVAVTGGIQSPFIWYALNPALVAATGLSTVYCWVTLGASLGVAVLAYRTLFRHQAVTWLAVVRQNSNLILLFVMITMAVQLFSAFARKLESRNEALRGQREELRSLSDRLQAESERAKGLLHEIMALYQALEASRRSTTREDLVQTFVTYAVRLTGSPLAFYAAGHGERHEILVQGKAPPDLPSLIMSLPASLTGLARLSSEDGDLLVAPLRSGDGDHGLLGVLLGSGTPELDYHRELAFLAELAALTLERLRLEDAHDQLVMFAEHERIAGEMHDRVAQRIFSLVYAFHGVPRRWPDLPEDLKQHLAMLQSAASDTLRELRSVIRQLTDEDQDEATDLLADVRRYCTGLEELHQVSVEFAAQGELGRLPAVLRQSILRVLAEASSNALRHGHAQQIQVDIRRAADDLSLTVQDDGAGFDVDAPQDDSDVHLGLRNMRSLAERMGGTIDIRSRPGEGTRVKLDLALGTLWGGAVR